MWNNFKLIIVVMIVSNIPQIILRKADEVRVVGQIHIPIRFDFDRPNVETFKLA